MGDGLDGERSEVDIAQGSLLRLWIDVRGVVAVVEGSLIEDDHLGRSDDTVGQHRRERREVRQRDELVRVGGIAIGASEGCRVEATLQKPLGDLLRTGERE